MSERPWFKFYATDWRSDAKLGLTSLAARGLWVGVMALMHDEGDPYGHLNIGGHAPTMEQLAALIGRPVDEVSSAYDELERFGILEKNQAGIVFSRRMVRDEKRRIQGKRHGKKGGNPALTHGLTPPDNGGLKPPPDSDSDSSESLSGNKKKRVAEFDEWWIAYPKKVAKKKSREKWVRLVASDEMPPLVELLTKLKRQKSLDRSWREGFIPNPLTYLNGARWEDEIDPMPPTAGPKGSVSPIPGASKESREQISRLD